MVAQAVWQVQLYLSVSLIYSSPLLRFSLAIAFFHARELRCLTVEWEGDIILLDVPEDIFA